MNPLIQAPARAAAAPHSRVGQTRPHWLNSERLRLYPLVALACYVLATLSYLVRVLWLHPGEHLGPISLDFVAFWSASHLALQGHAMSAYHVPTITAVETAALGHDVGLLPWLYPPTFLLFVYPLALMPYRLAATVFLGFTLLAFVAVCHATLPRRRVALIALAFPGAAIVLAAGQNGLLTASFIGLGLVMLERRPWLAGFCLGLLCIKPHLAVLIPLALLGSRSWRALFATAATALAMLAVSTLAFGFGTLQAFVQNMGLIAGFVDSGVAALARIPTFFSLARMLHVPTSLAYALQGVSACVGALAVIYAWWRPCAFELRAATLVCATLMVSPYLFDYDLTWYGILIVWFARYALKRGFLRWEKEWLALLWVVPVSGIAVIDRLHFQFFPLVTCLTLAMLLRRVALERRMSAGMACRLAAQETP
ncbi:glycosyltransferase family 87 protein [Paraburkholderia ferrariae]|uniref:glycosyltransferase family 87 protein n=1 Tax=Paraburkholderia ferrariae TaxID=386056 RepID=UPI0005A6D1DA|nr:glycosyltransferase family 87 protein [Paraburkholderia ferrariae]